MPQLFVAEELDFLLQTWEDSNLIGDLEFSFHQATKANQSRLPPKPYDDTNIVPLIGSELNLLGYLARAIPEYGMLRKILSGRSYSHPTHFLPRIPKDLKSAISNPTDFTFHQMVKSIVRIPMYLQKWNETRRACIVEDSIPIPSISLKEDNWLACIPYPSFYLKVRSPFVINDHEGRSRTIENFIVYDEGEYVRILFWANENKEYHLDDTARKEVPVAINELQKNKFTNLSKKYISLKTRVEEIMVADFCVEKNGSRIMELGGMECQPVFNDLYDNEVQKFETEDEVALYQKIKGIIEMVNGFCRLTAELPPRPATVVVDSEETHPQHISPRQWIELPMQTIEYFHTETETGTVVIRHGSGSEKSPHYRRGHYRRIQQKNGPEKLVWVESVIVREDRLSVEQLQGGAMKIK
jgi:hypothetical protein